MRIAETGSSVLVDVRGHESRGIRIANMVQAYQRQGKKRDTAEARLDRSLPVAACDDRQAA